MELTFQHQICTLLGLMLLLPALCVSQYSPSRATFYGSPDCYGTPTGACGFGEFGRNVNDGSVSGVSRLYRDGTGCGACYQVRCTNPHLCSSDGASVVVTDYGEGDHTDFILSPRAYTKLANPGAEIELFGRGVVDVEFKRVSCQYSSASNAMFQIHEHSRFPQYLALVVINVAGQNDVACVEVWQEDCKEWVPMRRAYGAVWDLSNPPKDGALTLRFQVMAASGTAFWAESTNAIPQDWKVGAAYDSKVQLN